MSGSSSLKQKEQELSRYQGFIGLFLSQAVKSNQAGAPVVNEEKLPAPGISGCINILFQHVISGEEKSKKEPDAKRVDLGVLRPLVFESESESEDEYKEYFKAICQALEHNGSVYLLTQPKAKLARSYRFVFREDGVYCIVYHTGDAPEHHRVQMSTKGEERAESMAVYRLPAGFLKEEKQGIAWLKRLLAPDNATELYEVTLGQVGQRIEDFSKLSSERSAPEFKNLTKDWIKSGREKTFWGRLFRPHWRAVLGKKNYRYLSYAYDLYCLDQQGS